jgi:hypothetical protein
MTPSPKFSPDQIAAIAGELLKCHRLLRRTWHEDNRRQVLARRAALYRLLYDLPDNVPAPIDWQPAPHPQTTAK